MFNRSKAFEIPDDGLLLENGIHIISGESEPSAIIVTGPTIYMQLDGTIWKNDGIGSWSRVGSLNFAFRKVDQSLTIPNNQQMLIQGEFIITENGSLIIENDAQFIIKES